jgi:hypothetical protein
MQITDLIFLGLAAFVAADCDGPDCSTTSSSIVATTTAVVAADGSSSTSSDGFNGVVLTQVSSSTDVDLSTSLVPVLTQDVATSTDVVANTSLQSIRETTDIGTTATNTIVQVATTTDVGLAGGYAYTTNSEGSTIATYTGSDTSKPRTSSVSSSLSSVVSSAASSGSAAAAGASSSTGASSDSFAMATAVPYIGAAAMAGLALVI